MLFDIYFLVIFVVYTAVLYFVYQRLFDD